MEQISQLTVKKKVNNHFEIVRLQVLISLSLNYKDLKFSHTEIDCITFLAIMGEIKINAFCLYLVNKGVYKHKQSVRNFITELLLPENNIIVKSDKKEISLNIPNVYAEGSCIVNYLIGFKSHA